MSGGEATRLGPLRWERDAVLCDRWAGFSGGTAVASAAWTGDAWTWAVDLEGFMDAPGPAARATGTVKTLQAARERADAEWREWSERMCDTPDGNNDAPTLAPCPFCGAGVTEVRANRGTWRGMAGYSEPVSVEVRHWCPPAEGQPQRGGITFVGRDEASAVALWNRRTDAPAVPGDAAAPGSGTARGDGA